MDPILVIENRGRRLDRRYILFLVVFWLIWTPATLYVTYLAITQFHWGLVVWLVGGYVVAVGIPLWLRLSRQPQIFSLQDDSLEIEGTGGSFRKTKRLGLTEPLMLHFGKFDDESFVTLNLFYGEGFYDDDRIMLAPMLHWEEKYQTLKELAAFLNAHQFDLEVRDEMTIADV